MGTSGVGKSSLMIKYIQKKFECFHIVTIEREKYSKSIKINDNDVNLNFLDLAGDPQYQAKNYDKEYTEADIFIIMYDVTSKKSFINACGLYEQVRNYNSSLVMVGNKIDQKYKEVKKEEASEWCSSRNIDHIEISVKENTNFNRLFDIIIKHVLI